MMTTLTKTTQEQPKFCPFQQVYFLGGMGKIVSRFTEAGKWMYAIEMPLGKEPEIGRIGSETIILMQENEIKQLEA